MACCTFNGLFIADMKFIDINVNCISKSHLIHTRNSQYKLSIPMNRVYNLSRSTTRTLPPSFSLLEKGNSSLAQSLSPYSADDDDDDDGGGDDLQNKHQKSKVVAEPALEDALVQVICIFKNPCLTRPWLTDKDSGGNCNGFIIEGRRLLTCAHCVEHHTNVTIKKHGSETIYQATVLAIADDFDLAILTVSDDEFWEGVGAVELGDIPSPRDELTIMSYLNGNNNITSRKGIILHMGMELYSQGKLKLPAFTVNYDPKFGQSGSAVFNKNGKCVGMAFQRSSRNNTGDVIPVTIIKHFIQDYNRNGGYTGLPIFGVNWQKMENHDLRMSMRIQHDQEGVLIRHVDANYPELQVLKPNDVILSIDGVKIANDGTVPFVRGQRIDFNYLFTQKYTGDNVLVGILRDSERHEFGIKLATHKQFVPGNVKGRTQNYYIIGGLVFRTRTIPYIELIYDEENYGCILDELFSRALHEECVVVCQVLKSEVNEGYATDDIVDHQVLSFNGKPVEGMKGLVSMVESCREEYLKFILENQQTVVLRTITTKEKTPEILKTYGILSAMSDDLKT